MQSRHRFWPQHSPAAAHMTESGHRSCWVLREGHSRPADSGLRHKFTTAGGTRREPYKLVNRTHLYPLPALGLRQFSLPSAWILALKPFTEVDVQISVFFNSWTRFATFISKLSVVAVLRGGCGWRHLSVSTERSEENAVIWEGKPRFQPCFAVYLCILHCKEQTFTGAGAETSTLVSSSPEWRPWSRDESYFSVNNCLIILCKQGKIHKRDSTHIFENSFWPEPSHREWKMQGWTSLEEECSIPIT